MVVKSVEKSCKMLLYSIAKMLLFHTQFKETQDQDPQRENNGGQRQELGSLRKPLITHKAYRYAGHFLMEKRRRNVRVLQERKKVKEDKVDRWIEDEILETVLYESFKSYLSNLKIAKIIYTEKFDAKKRKMRIASQKSNLKKRQNHS